MAADNFEQLKQAKQNRIQSFAFVIGASICVLFCIGFAASTLADLRPSREFELEGRINPNNAPLASLVRLPGIGLGRAEAIMAYRKDFSLKNSNRPAFRNCDDLQKVKGIGPKTVQNVNERLRFE
jgi:competence ComEA-like helix-hairpin-helix protein